MVDESKQAFPRDRIGGSGMTLREWYAGLARQGLLVGPLGGNWLTSPQDPDRQERLESWLADGMIRAAGVQGPERDHA